MMAEPLSREVIRKARGLVLCDRSKNSVTKQLGIGITTMYRHTKDIPSHKHQRIDKEIIQRIIEEVLKIKLKYQIAKDMGSRFGIIYYHTMDLPNHVYREERIQGQVLDLLKELMKNGYIVSTEENIQRCRRLQKYLPMIQQKKSKIFSYQELASMSRVFDVNLPSKEKWSFLLRK